MAKCGIKLFLIVIYHSSLVKAAMNTARVCKMRNGVSKTPSKSSFSTVKGGMNILRSNQNSSTIINWKTRKRTNTLTTSTFRFTNESRIIYIYMQIMKKTPFLSLPRVISQLFNSSAKNCLFKGIVKWQRRGGLSGINRTIMTSHAIAYVF